MSLIYDLELILKANEQAILDDEQAINALHKVVENYDTLEQKELSEIERSNHDSR